MLERAREREAAAERHARRRPKQLDSAPLLLTTVDGQGLAISGEARKSSDSRVPGRVAFGDDVAEQDDEDAAGRAVAQTHVHGLARSIAARLALAPPRERRPRARGTGTLRSVPYRGGGDDLDLDRTLEALVEHRGPSAEDVFVRERRRRRRAFVLAVDVSGSMRGERLEMTAAAVGALTAELAREALAIIAFWSDAAAIVRFEEHATLEQVVDALLSIAPRGLTNVGFPLAFAEQELARMPTAHDRRVILLSDCVHNAGPHPAAAAARLPRLDILFDVTGECDAGLARELARSGRGRVVPVGHLHEVAPALNQILEG